MKHLFIINPKSGTVSTRQRAQVIELIERKATAHRKNIEIVFTQKAGHATELARNAALKNVGVVVAVGGDGTMNEIAKSLIDTNTTLGILPMGSGNGLARHLGIPMDGGRAIDRIFQGKTALIDAGIINTMPFFCTAGFGFDAFVADRFARQPTRGLATYVQTSLTSLSAYEPQNYVVNGEPKKLFAMTFANASQYGNNAYVAPQANASDGLLDLVLLRPFPLFMFPNVSARLFLKSLPHSRFIDTFEASRAVVEAESNFLIHYDGEPLQLATNRLEVSINPKCLNVIL